MQRSLFKKQVVANVDSLPAKIPALPVNDEDLVKYSPMSWNEYYETKEIVHVNEDKHFAVFRSTAEEKKQDSVHHLFVLVHGAGHTALSWGVASKLLKQRGNDILSYDLRGHGCSKVDSPLDDCNFNVNVLAMDLVNILSTLYSNDIPNIILVGHSMGGSIVSTVASGPHGECNEEDKDNWNRVIKSIKALVVVDVVEGTALEALPKMTQILKNRPISFPSIESVIQWTIQSNLVKNLSSAKVSVPPQVELNEELNEYIWRTDLLASEPYWKSWFEGLSSKFLSSKVPKMLILAGTDRLDTELTIAQMQGKYQLVVLPTCGHCIQEDVNIIKI